MLLKSCLLHGIFTCVSRVTRWLTPLLQDVFARKVRKIYEQINEDTMESTYEFLSEADMEGLGWSTSLGLTLHSCDLQKIAFQERLGIRMFFGAKALQHSRNSFDHRLPYTVARAFWCRRRLIRQKIRGAKKFCQGKPNFTRPCEKSASNGRSPSAGVSKYILEVRSLRTLLLKRAFTAGVKQ